MMKVNNINSNNLSFKQAPLSVAELAEARIAKLKAGDIPGMIELSKGAEAPKHLQWIAKAMKKLVPWVEKNVIQPAKGKIKGKYDLEDLVNVGNVFKELACMIVYPAQVLTNPDLPKDKRRFVGMYDFFVTCFSLGGTLLYAWKGKGMAKAFAEKAMKKYGEKEAVKYFPKENVKRAIEGGAFVTGIAVQTILFKRVIAPALSPPLAGAVRKHWEAQDAEKAKAQGKTIEDKKPEDKNNSSTLIPPEYDAALGMISKESNLLKAFKNKNA